MAFPSWTPETLQKLTVKERDYWAQWSRAYRDRDD